MILVGGPSAHHEWDGADLVGLLRVPAKRGGSRIRDAVERLLAEGRVTRFDPSAARYRPERFAEPLAKAERCARLVLERLAESRK